MRLKCPYCSRDIPASDMNLETSLAKCAGYHALFGMRQYAEDGTPQPENIKERMKIGRALPANFDVRNHGGTNEISYHWRTNSLWGMVFFCEFSGLKVNESNTYNVSVLLRSGKRLPLIKYLKHSEQALTIEQATEKILGIENKRVVGELR